MVPGVSAFDPPVDPGFQRGALVADDPVTAELVKHLSNFGVVVADVQVHGDDLRQLEAEPGGLLQGRTQERRVVMVGRGDDDTAGTLEP